MKVIIVGGTAGGASCAARLRRLDEDCEILLLERGPFVSYDNCGLPYHVSGIYEKEYSLFLKAELTFKAIYRIDCRTNCEVIGISAKNKTVQIQNLKTDAISVETYDKLVLSPGAEPGLHPFPGMDLPGIFSLRTVPDDANIRKWLNLVLMENARLNSFTGFQTGMKHERAVVVGGGFIGMKMVENFVQLGFEVTLIEKSSQLMPTFDPEMARLLEKYMVKHGVRLVLDDGVGGFEKSTNGSLEVITSSCKKHPADIVILAIGVKPETRLAKMAGIEIGMHGGMRVDEHLRTSNPDIFAVGDGIEVKDFVTGQWMLLPPDGHANRQGRIAADVIAGCNSVYRGIQGIAIFKIFEVTVAKTGISEKVLSQAGSNDFEEIYIYQGSNTGYNPGVRMLSVKVIYRKSDRHLLGAQILGEEGVSRANRRIGIENTNGMYPG